MQRMMRYLCCLDCCRCSKRRAHCRDLTDHRLTADVLRQAGIDPPLQEDEVVDDEEQQWGSCYCPARCAAAAGTSLSMATTAHNKGSESFATF